MIVRQSHSRMYGYDGTNWQEIKVDGIIFRCWIL
jgi:hypothetical protein